MMDTGDSGRASEMGYEPVHGWAVLQEIMASGVHHCPAVLKGERLALL